MNPPLAIRCLNCGHLPASKVTVCPLCKAAAQVREDKDRQLGLSPVAAAPPDLSTCGDLT